MDPHPHPAQRLDAHNASIDEDVSRAGGCAQVHLATGATCSLTFGHAGSCDFVRPAPARDECGPPPD